MTLELAGIEAGYGGARVVQGVSLAVPPGRIVALLGPNGAGKSTTLRVVAGLLRPRGGEVRLDGERIAGLPPDAVLRRGLALVPERRELFPSLSVAENLDLGAYARRDRAGIAADLEMVFALFPRLRERRTQPARTLSGGEQQMLAIARGLMSRPRYLLLDEPSLGLAPLLIEEIFRKLVEIRAHGTAILLVEQNAAAALRVADHGYVLETGIIRLEGSAAALAADDAVRDAYLR
ncbi:ABC transporter ATP-binding protein [Caldovatus sediminis]|uniref:ABC transporter ATP-binding protein n=1 Tax=Caldovatus sediminis TaxID=2041189 RepID=A0A8J3ECF3_9PROT|nr:ABC transporter ATP-binding protein [Caldovatus sediminis]GGG21630.1 ABC transporter ATP-binding protein [Caldovatus sediminis]